MYRDNLNHINNISMYNCRNIVWQATPLKASSQYAAQLRDAAMRHIYYAACREDRGQVYPRGMPRCTRYVAARAQCSRIAAVCACSCAAYCKLGFKGVACETTVEKHVIIHNESQQL